MDNQRSNASEALNSMAGHFRNPLALGTCFFFQHSSSCNKHVSHSMAAWKKHSQPIQSAVVTRSLCEINNTINLSLTPKRSLLDEPIRIHVTGLPPRSPVSIRTTVERPEEKIRFGSMAHYLTTPDGILNTSQHASLGGSYEGVDAMGPFWSMKPFRFENGDMSYDRLLLVDVTQPLTFNVEIFLGHLKGDISEKPPERRLLQKAECERVYMGKGVKRILIAEKGIRGTLFLPSMENRTDALLPLIITLYGGILRGNVVEEKAAMLASHGFASLALAFFGVPDLPKRYDDGVDLEYFESAIDHVLNTFGDVIDGQSVGIFGVSKGGDIALSLSAFLPHKIKSTVVVNCCVSSVASPTKYKDKVVQGLKFDTTDVSKFKIRDEGVIDMLGIMNSVEDHPETVIPFASSPVPILWMAGDADHNYESAQYALMAKQWMMEAGKTNFEVKVYEEVGHLVDLPYSPVAPTSLHPLAPKGIKLYMGGEDRPELHVAGQIDMWKQTVMFFTNTLTSGNHKNNTEPQSNL